MPFSYERADMQTRLIATERNVLPHRSEAGQVLPREDAAVVSFGAIGMA